MNDSELEDVSYCWICRTWRCCMPLFSHPEEDRCCLYNSQRLPIGRLITPDVLLNNMERLIQISLEKHSISAGILNAMEKLEGPISYYDVWRINEGMIRRISQLETEVSLLKTRIADQNRPRYA